jgi:serine/threonine-protein kinase PknG
MNEMDGQACEQTPGCTGTIDDGYCDLCGMAPASAALQAPPPPVTPAPGGLTGSVRSSGHGPAPSGSAKAATGTRRVTSATTARPSGRLGLGLISVPEVPVPEPMSMVLANPEVPEHKRFCGRCGEPVGRSRLNRQGRLEGTCVSCGQPFSFVPKLHPGDVVGGQYEIAGCLAHGGLGWVYLARDLKVEFWVALKGLLDSGDADAMAAAVAERRFLASLEHPNIVKIHNFVNHEGADYIVMEYVGGTSLRDLLKQQRRDGRFEPLPVAQAVSYILEILPALGYLHRLGLLYCDFKPENVILQHDNLKLIDLGGARRLDDDSAAVFGTLGFQAPEIEELGPSVASDLFTVGRTLAVMIMDFRGYQGTFRHSLPEQAEQAVLVENESLYRFLCKATAAHPDDRFQSADEMAAQLLGVLRETVATEADPPPPAASSLFAADADPRGETDEGELVTPAWETLPTLRVSADDTSFAALATLPDVDARTQAALLEALTPRTVEVELRLARAQMESGGVDCDRTLDRIEAGDPWEWRVEWYRGLLALTGGDHGRAVEAFDRVYSEVPGELAPKLALALVTESCGDRATAAHLYDLVSRTDPSCTSAAFGLARCRFAAGDRAGAVAAYHRVPPASSSYVRAQMQAARALVLPTDAGPPSREELVTASRIAERLPLDAQQRGALTRDVLTAALRMLRSGELEPDEAITVAGWPLRERDVRLGLERAYRALARYADSAAARVALVDRANRVRPRSLV